MSEFTEKNKLRKLHKHDDGAKNARILRQLGLPMRMKETIPSDLGEDIVREYEVTGVPGAFGNANNQEWNARVAGTSGIER